MKMRPLFTKKSFVNKTSFVNAKAFANKAAMLTVTALLTAALFCGCNKSSSAKYKTMKDLEGLVLAAKEGTTGAIIVKQIKGAQLRAFNNGPDAAIALKNYAVDAVVFDELPALEILKYNNDLEILELDFPVEEYGIGVSKDTPELLEKINDTLDAMKADGRYQRIYDMYFSPEGEPVPYEPYIIKGAPVLRVGTDKDFAPFEYTEYSRLYGFDIELCKEIAKTLNYNLEILNMNFDGLVSSLHSGGIDFIAAAMTITDKRKELIDFSKPYFTSRQVLIVRK